ncbi:hypothetical protein GOBAR_DD28979 [Gossypium barbadense]|nr:hypothetical protein GOBAR_DD28979 [Gossypium barbadense]
MVELDIQIPTTFDPFAEAEEFGRTGTKDYVHIRIQQRNGRKNLTTVEELGKIIQLQGDQRKKVAHFLVNAGIVKKEQIKIHGF